MGDNSHKSKGIITSLRSKKIIDEETWFNRPDANVLTRENIIHSLRRTALREGKGRLMFRSSDYINARDLQIKPDSGGQWGIGWDKILRGFKTLGYEVTFTIRKKEPHDGRPAEAHPADPALRQAVQDVPDELPSSRGAQPDARPALQGLRQQGPTPSAVGRQAQEEETGKA